MATVKLQRGRRHFADLILAIKEGKQVGGKSAIEGRTAVVDITPYEWGCWCECQAELPEGFECPPAEFTPSISLRIGWDGMVIQDPGDGGVGQRGPLDDVLLDFLDGIPKWCVKLDPDSDTIGRLMAEDNTFDHKIYIEGLAALRFDKQDGWCLRVRHGTGLQETPLSTIRARHGSAPPDKAIHAFLGDAQLALAKLRALDRCVETGQSWAAFVANLATIGSGDRTLIVRYEVERGARERAKAAAGERPQMPTPRVLSFTDGGGVEYSFPAEVSEEDIFLLCFVLRDPDHPPLDAAARGLSPYCRDRVMGALKLKR